MLNDVTIKNKEVEVGSGSFTRLSRVNGYTTNGLWLIKSQLESTCMKRLSENTQLSEEAVEKVINRAQEGVLAQLSIVKIKELNDTLTVELQDDKGNQFFVNAHFLKLVVKDNDVTIYGNLSYKYQPVIIKRNNELMGLVMPLNIQEL